jgi:hypothetical protein
MAQPPGSETSACAEARQQRPQHQNRGAHGLDQLIGRMWLCGCEVSTSIASLVDHQPTPMQPSSSMVVVMSCRCGTLVIRTGASASRVAPQRIGSAAFLAPEMRTSPSSLAPPVMPLDRAHAAEPIPGHHHLKVVAVAIDLCLAAGKPGLDECLDLVQLHRAVTDRK